MYGFDHVWYDHRPREYFRGGITAVLYFPTYLLFYFIWLCIPTTNLSMVFVKKQLPDNLYQCVHILLSINYKNLKSVEW